MNSWEPKALMSYWEENIKHDQRGAVCVIIWPIVFKECHTNIANYAERLNYVIPIQQAMPRDLIMSYQYSSYE